MAHSEQSQWDFGELFTPDETRDVLTVSELTSRVKGALESEVGQVWVEGEITNLRAQASGHMYFSIKDERTQQIMLGMAVVTGLLLFLFVSLLMRDERDARRLRTEMVRRRRSRLDRPQATTESPS